MTVNNNFLKTIIDKIPSLDCRNYLEENTNSLSSLQWGTIIMEASFLKDERIELFNKLLNLAKSDYEAKLISMAISDLKRYGYISRRVDNYFNRHDHRETNNACAFNEYIDFPVLFKKGDVACLKDGEKMIHVVIAVSPSSRNNEKQEFGDSSYLAYELVPFSKLFDIHCHLHPIKLNCCGFNQLTSEEKTLYERIMAIIKDDDYLNK